MALDDHYQDDVNQHLDNVRELGELKGSGFVENITQRLRDAGRGDEVPQAIARHLAHAKVDINEVRYPRFQPNF